MSSISIKNIGPLVDTGEMALSQYNIIIGKQSTGKSTIMKILCFCKWIEKRIMTGEKSTLSNYTHYARFLKELKQFHRLNDTFFSSRSEIHYRGECIDIDLVGNKNVIITKRPNFINDRHNTKLSFIPSERNLVTAIKNVDRVYKANTFDVLFNHVFEWSEAKENYSEEYPIDLKVVDNMDYYYDAGQEADVIRLKNRRIKISPFYASSGVQSALPIIVMVDYFTGSVFDRTIDMSKKEVINVFKYLREDSHSNNATIDIERFAKIYNYNNAQLFIEEPEQNLFPESQQVLVEHLVKSIARATSKTESNSSVTITTHSPYIITAFNVLFKAAKAKKINEEKTYGIVSSDAIVEPDMVRAYYISENGTLTDIFNTEVNMISGLELDSVSDSVENKLNRLNDIIYAD